MSLVSSYIHCKDGKWYQDLEYRDANNEWFVCFDDDDPVELVMKRKCGKNPTFILEQLGIRYDRIKKQDINPLRHFSGDVFEPAVAYWVYGSWSSPFPTPGKNDTYDKVFDLMPYCGALGGRR